MMHMTFYWGKTVTILFDSWKTDSWISYFISLFACFFAAAFYQYMENLRVEIKKLPPSPSGGSSTVATPLLSSKFSAGKWSATRFSGAILFGVNSAFGYFLMLAIMSFNGGVFVAVVFGLAIGYLVFRSGDEGGVTVVDSPCACA